MVLEIFNDIRSLVCSFKVHFNLDVAVKIPKMLKVRDVQPGKKPHSGRPEKSPATCAMTVVPHPRRV